MLKLICKENLVSKFYFIINSNKMDDNQNLIEWQWKSNLYLPDHSINSWTAYTSDICKIIEKAYEQKENSV